MSVSADTLSPLERVRRMAESHLRVLFDGLDWELCIWPCAELFDHEACLRVGLWKTPSFRLHINRAPDLEACARQLVDLIMGSWHGRQEPSPEIISMRDIDAYTVFTRTTACNPGAKSSHIQNLAYLALGLSSEAGEVAGKLKKVLREDPVKPTHDQILDECGDVFWYLCRLIEDLGGTPSEVLFRNKVKLEDRLARGVVKGSGDVR